MNYKIFLIIVIISYCNFNYYYGRFIVPHYDCPNCNFKFWGKYHHQNDCIQNCTKFSYSPKNRFFCAKIWNNLDK